MSSGGLSSTRLDRLHAVMAGHVARGEFPGVVTLVHRRGETHVDTIGTQAVGGDAPMRHDTIFRIASLSKPITAVAAMILVETCRLRLDESLDAWLPELANRQVLRTIDGPVEDTVPAERPITLRDLLTFRLGLGDVMINPPQYPIQHAMIAAGVAPSAHLLRHPPDDLLRRYGSLPLLHQPGERWLYDIGTNILGVLIARVSGQSFGTFLRDNIFEPLGMKDTGFRVPVASIDRLATCYHNGDEPGTLAVFDAAQGGRFASPPPFESGSGGLVSTVDDYLAFYRMLLNKGCYGNERILSRPSVELMTTDHITPEQKALSGFIPNYWPSNGWGFGLGIITRRDDLAGTPGRFGWAGGYGTSAYADPTEDLIAIMMTQRLVNYPNAAHVVSDFWTSVYQAVDD